MLVSCFFFSLLIRMFMKVYVCFVVVVKCHELSMYKCVDLNTIVQLETKPKYDMKVRPLIIITFFTNPSNFLRRDLFYNNTLHKCSCLHLFIFIRILLPLVVQLKLMGTFLSISLQRTRLFLLCPLNYSTYR